MTKAFTLCLVTLACSAACAQDEPVQDLPLRSESAETIVADLEAFIPLRMAEEGVTGLSVALISDNRIVWRQGYGRVNSLLGGSVDTETVFSAASLGKAVSAYAAMSLVADSTLELDQSLRSYLRRPWVPESMHHNAISLRHVLTHTSGLSNFLRDEAKELKFEPGSEFSYSGVGFMYMQAVLEHVSSVSLDELARRKVFTPLEMDHSFFGRPIEPAESISHGHVAFGRAIAPFLVIFLPSFVVLLIGASLFARLRGSWRPTLPLTIASVVIASIGTFLFLEAKAGGAILATYFTFCGSLITALWIGAMLIGRRVLRRQSPTKRQILFAAWGLASAALLLLALRNVPAPLPNWFPDEGNAASSLRSTPSDLANFLIELSTAGHLDSTFATQMVEAQVMANEHVSWGLGVGIQHSEYGESLWHWGSNPGSKNLMVIYPEQGVGIVVLSNSSNASDLVVEIASRALGGKAHWDT